MKPTIIYKCLLAFAFVLTTFIYSCRGNNELHDTQEQTVPNPLLNFDTTTKRYDTTLNFPDGNFIKIETFVCAIPGTKLLYPNSGRHNSAFSTPDFEMQINASGKNGLIFSRSFKKSEAINKYKLDWKNWTVFEAPSLIAYRAQYKGYFFVIDCGSKNSGLLDRNLFMLNEKGEIVNAALLRSESGSCCTDIQFNQDKEEVIGCTGVYSFDKKRNHLFEGEVTFSSLLNDHLHLVIRLAKDKTMKNAILSGPDWQPIAEFNFAGIIHGNYFMNIADVFEVQPDETWALYDGTEKTLILIHAKAPHLSYYKLSELSNLDNVKDEKILRHCFQTQDGFMTIYFKQDFSPYGYAFGEELCPE